jgi:hypothetical protein
MFMSAHVNDSCNAQSAGLQLYLGVYFSQIFDCIHLLDLKRKGYI